MDYTDDLARVQPHDAMAETCLLGAMLHSHHAIADALAVCEAQDFYNPHHATIFTTAVQMFTAGMPVDAATMRAELAKCGELTRVGGPTYLLSLLEATTTTASAPYYARLVAEAAKKRRLLAAAMRIQTAAYSDTVEAEEALSIAHEELARVPSARTAAELRPAADLVPAALAEAQASDGGEGHGLDTGFADLDAMLAGFRPGQLIVFAGRPGTGKSTLALNVAAHNAMTRKVPVAFFSLEMSGPELVTKVLSGHARVLFSRLRGGGMQPEDWARLHARAPEVSHAPLYVDDTASATPAEIRAKSARMAAQVGLGMVVVDYLQLMSSGQRVESRQQEVAGFSRALKLIAKELEVPVVALSQLNRGSEGRADKKPMLSDLRESGGIEADADIVVMVHRPDMYDPDCERAGEADLIVAKARNGPTGTVAVAWQGHYSRFVGMAPEMR